MGLVSLSHSSFLGSLCITLAGLWRAERDGPQGAFLQPIAQQLARKAMQRTVRARVITDRRELCRGSLGTLASVTAPLRSPAESFARWLGLAPQAWRQSAFQAGSANARLVLPQSTRLVHRRPSPFIAKGPLRGASSFHAPPANRLRVVREIDSTARCGAAGRMIISGRMADVCAELDRMVQSEVR
jgi:hypothetical protein